MGKKSEIVVKKRLAERVAFHCLGGAFVVSGIVVMITGGGLGDELEGFGILLGALIGLIGLFAQLYFELWRITFTSKEIRVRRWPFRERTYSYSMIKEVTKGRSVAEKDYLIYCKFTDGKGVAFRMKDVNADLAIKRLLSHRTIRTVRYYGSC